jgi:hypothetical protein
MLVQLRCPVMLLLIDKPYTICVDRLYSTWTSRKVQVDSMVFESVVIGTNYWIEPEPGAMQEDKNDFAHTSARTSYTRTAFPLQELGS